MLGWKRELVYRNTSESALKKMADIYYYTPSGKKVRSNREVMEYCKYIFVQWRMELLQSIIPYYVIIYNRKRKKYFKKRWAFLHPVILYCFSVSCGLMVTFVDLTSVVQIASAASVLLNPVLPLFQLSYYYLSTQCCNQVYWNRYLVFSITQNLICLVETTFSVEVFWVVMLSGSGYHCPLLLWNLRSHTPVFCQTGTLFQT